MATVTGRVSFDGAPTGGSGRPRYYTGPIFVMAPATRLAQGLTVDVDPS